MEIGRAFGAFALNLLLCQATLLPLAAVYALVVARFTATRLSWVLHVSLLVAGLGLPLLPLASLASSVGPAFGPGLARAAEPVARFFAGPPRATASSATAEPDSGRGGTAGSDAPGMGSAVARPETTALGRPAAALTRADVLGSAALGSTILGFLAYCALAAGQITAERKLRRRAESIRRIGRLRVVATREVGIPFAGGLLVPTIYIPGSMLRDPIAHRYSISHEGAHVRLGHLAWTYAERLCAHVLWWSPLAHLLAWGGKLLREVAADRRAVRRTSARQYGLFLIECARGASRLDPAGRLAVAGRGASDLRVRLHRLARGDVRAPRSLSALTMVLIPVCVLLLGLAASCTTPPAAPASEEYQFAMQSSVLMSSADGAFGYKPEAAGDFLWLPTGDLTIRVAVASGQEAVDAITRDVNALRVETGLRYPFLRRVYADAARRGDAPTGEVVLSWTVNPDARISDVSVESSTTGDGELDRSIAACLQAWTLRGRTFSGAYALRMHLRFDARSSEDGGTALTTSFGFGTLPGLGLEMLARLDGLRDSTGGTIRDTEILGSYEATSYPEGTVLVSLAVSPDGRVTEARLLDSDVTDGRFTESLLAAAAKLSFSPPYDRRFAPLVLACTLVPREILRDGQISDLGIALCAEGVRGLSTLIGARASTGLDLAAWTGEYLSRDLWRTVLTTASVSTMRAGGGR